MALHDAGEDQPHRRDADLDDAAEAQMQRAVVAVDSMSWKIDVGRMQEQRQAELLDMGVERLQPLGIDARIVADAAGQVDAHQAEPIDRVVDHLDRGARVLQRHRGARPEPARIFASARRPSPRSTSARSRGPRRAACRRRHTENGPIEQTTSTWWPRLSMYSNCLSRSNHSAQELRCWPLPAAAHVVVAAALVDSAFGKSLRLQSLSKIDRGHQWKCESMMCTGRLLAAASSLAIQRF